MVATQGQSFASTSADPSMNYADHAAHSAPPHVEMRGVVKRFGGTLALAGVDFAVEPGEIHALVGENGAGKSTLMHILAGLVSPDQGDILLYGRRAAIRSVEAAYAHGIAMVHQHFMLLPSLTAAENLTLGREPRRNGLFDRKAAETAVRDLGERYGLHVNPATRVADLSLGDLQRLEILRALYRGADLLILDEPTGVLTPQEAQGLFRVIRELAHEGKTTLFISHKLDEVLEISDQITVLRDGQVTGRRTTRDAHAAELARLMVGREMRPLTNKPLANPARSSGTTVLELDGVHGRGVYGVSLQVHDGEIVGIAGVAGNGQSELADLIAGLLPTSAGNIRIAQKTVTHATVAERRAAGLAYIPEDRYKQGLAVQGSLSDNLLLGAPNRQPLFRGGRIQWRAVQAWAETLIQKFGIRAANTRVAAKSLSGGNAQRIVIARELAEAKPFILAAQPTRGVDIAASEFVRDALLQRRNAGAGVLLISADLGEILQCCDRVVVMFEGRIVGELRLDRVDDEAARLTQIGLLMAGVVPSAGVEQAHG